jgi:hypothetical protein
MKRAGFVLIVLGLLTACTNSSDSKIRIDSIGKKFDSAAERTMDTAIRKGKGLKDKIKEKFNNKDSLHK